MQILSKELRGDFLQTSYVLLFITSGYGWLWLYYDKVYNKHLVMKQDTFANYKLECKPENVKHLTIPKRYIHINYFH